MYCGGGASYGGGGGYMPPPPPPGPDDCNDCENDDCVQLQTTYETKYFPCTRNVTRNYNVKVPRTVKRTVQKRVPYMDTECRTRTVPVMTMRPETRWRTEQERYQETVCRTDTIMVPVIKKEPRTVYVDVTKMVPKQVQRNELIDRYRPKSVPYTVQVPHTKYTTHTDRIPVTKYKTEFDTVYSTVYENQTRSVCTPVTRMVRKRIPVVRAVVRPPGPCPPRGDDPQAIVDRQEAHDLNKDGVVTRREAVVSGLMEGRTPHQSLREFRRQDLNKDGVVTTDEALASKGWHSARGPDPVYPPGPYVPPGPYGPGPFVGPGGENPGPGPFVGPGGEHPIEPRAGKPFSSTTETTYPIGSRPAVKY